MTAEEVDSTADILQNITAVNSSEPSVTRSVVETINNLMNVNEDELEEAAAKGSTNRAIRCLETQLQFVDVTTSNGTYKDVQPNLGVQVSEYSLQLLQTGLTFIYTTDDPRRPLRPEHIFVYIGNSENLDPGDMPIHARISLPTSLGRRIRRNSSRVSFVIYRTTALFMAPWLIEFNAMQTEFSRTANTRVISAAINAMPISNLSDPVMTSYHPIFTKANENIENTTNPVCVFWDFDADDGHGNWSDDGCHLTTSGIIHDYRCQCNHLTNFAILMDIYGNTLLTDHQDFVLEIMSYVGCCLSSICLGLTLCTFLSNKKLRKSQANRILASLSASLFSLYITFLLLLSLNHVAMVTCGVIVGFLHYSLLSSVSWMAVESFNMYLMVIRVFDRGGIPHFMIRAACFALGTPALIVGITSGVARQGYMSYSDNNQCGFLTLWPLVGGVLVPLAILIVYDALIFTLVMRRLSRKVAGKQITKPKYLERLHRLQNALALTVLMGLTWGVGFLTSIKVANLAFQIIFIILNSLQGVYLFLFYCLRNPIARMHWRNLLCPRRMQQKEKTTTVVSNCSSSSGNRKGRRSRASQETKTDEGKKIYVEDDKWYRKVGIDFNHVFSKQRVNETSVYTIELSSLPKSMTSTNIPYEGVFAFNNEFVDDNAIGEMEHVY
ncbi:adhesion G-protein coupled receptor G6-like isoform X1 [Lytechinus variegatus]|uniref:adhesion G-protein coupled receptor G6-like isoform X1 n=1 Tax=Lytechinus variegatus TaxID=7654 RepID=UPI001BB105E3|nr:adhesion G-protein coupled receptor G6-like isoform X1 [Lytechinus variegatus]